MAETLSKLDKEFVDKAAEDGLVEVEMAKLAKKKAGSAELKDFANVVIEDHKHAKKQLSEMAKKVGVKLPTTISEKHQVLLDKVSKYEGEQFEQHFISTVVKEHQKNLKLYHRESEHGGNDDLKHFASETVPVLEKHLHKAESLHGRA